MKDVLRIVMGLLLIGMSVFLFLWWIDLVPWHVSMSQQTAQASSSGTETAASPENPKLKPASCSLGDGSEPVVASSAEVIRQQLFGYWILRVKRDTEEYVDVPPGKDTQICLARSVAMEFRYLISDGTEIKQVRTKECITDASKCDPVPPSFDRAYFKPIDEDGYLEVRIYKK